MWYRSPIRVHSTSQQIRQIDEESSMEVKRVALVLADISGYTAFMRHHDTSILHAEQIITELLETVIDSSDHPLQVSKIEGDAVFFYAVADDDAARRRTFFGRPWRSPKH